MKNALCLVTLAALCVASLLGCDSFAGRSMSGTYALGDVSRSVVAEISPIDDGYRVEVRPAPGSPDAGFPVQCWVELRGERMTDAGLTFRSVYDGCDTLLPAAGACAEPSNQSGQITHGNSGLFLLAQYERACDRSYRARLQLYEVTR